MRNNLFYYATSELSQDAFICWIMSFARKEMDTSDSNSLRKYAIALLKSAIEPLNYMPEEEIFVTDIKRQAGKIDVLVTINDDYRLIVEDKTYTGTHDNQLKRYKEYVRDELHILENKIYGLYYKSSFEGEIQNIQEAGYTMLTLIDIYHLFKKVALELGEKNTKNNIFCDYYEMLEEAAEKSERYKTLPVKDWDYNMVDAFYDELRGILKQRKDGVFKILEFGYVSNPQGGFNGAWLFPQKKVKYKNIEYSPYLQIETIVRNDNGRKTIPRICLKLYVEDGYSNVEYTELKNALAYKDNTKWEYALDVFGYSKPKQLRAGKSMTLGMVDEKFENKEDIAKIFIKYVEKFKEVESYFISKN